MAAIRISSIIDDECHRFALDDNNKQLLKRKSQQLTNRRNNLLNQRVGELWLNFELPVLVSLPDYNQIQSRNHETVVDIYAMREKSLAGLCDCAGTSSIPQH